MTTPTTAPPFAPAKVYELSTAFWQTKLIMTASELGCSRGSRTARRRAPSWARASA
ncbi:hypothetical protein [Actinomadura sp. J1-007]|uniref:hypothetical protein n=1 Tax=Actinomadura sp. J1-007 TaxID=2661913 RepID=UPI001367B082|nr:hypothetical protein [Actinomadura sp. J1-007]